MYKCLMSQCAAQRGGMLSWILDNDNNYAKPFGDWVKGNAKEL